MFTKFVYEIFGVLVVLLVAAVVSHALKRLINVLRDMKHVSPVIANRLHTVRRWVIIVLAVLVILEALGIFRGTWALISTALAALALGFVAAWSVLSNATAALLILTFRPFRIGDEIELMELTNGFTIGGRVLDMNLLYTTLAVVPALDAAARSAASAADGTQVAPDTMDERTAVQRHDAEAARPPQLVRVPNNMMFQRPLRTRSAHAQESKAPFFSRPRD
jgi:small-conductance mechanosensitive channel